jgi:hypothetical protein
VSFAERLEAAASNTRHGPACAFDRLLAPDGPLDPEDCEALADALAQPVDRVRHKDIVTALGDVGHRVGAGTVGRHRRGECACQ